jgi:uncharacterized heparinase superfamily protein
MRTRCDHVFVDCGPVGLAGRGGHGHNDCLSFEATLDGETLFVDSGSYVYTASPGERNAFRSTLAHNTPTVDGEEQNRIPPHDLWRLSDDARPSVRRWRANGSRDLFVGSHSGYLRLPGRPLPVRSVALDRTRHVLVVLDEFEGRLEHELRVPFHLAPGVDVVEERPGRVELVAGEKRFSFRWTDEGAWECRVVSAETSPSYGVKRSTRSLRLTRRGPLAALLVVVAPAALEGPSADELARLLSRTADLLGSWSQALTNRPT